jgi:hypothetical protein
LIELALYFFAYSSSSSFFFSRDLCSVDVFGKLLIDSGMLSCSQKAHVQQFLATEDALNKAAEARDLSQKLVKRLHGNSDAVVGGASQTIGSLRQFEASICGSYGFKFPFNNNLGGTLPWLEVFHLCPCSYSFV